MPEELDAPVFLDWEEYAAILVRRRWWIALPAFILWALVWEVSWFLPATYQSEALILVEQQKVPDQYVVPNITGSLEDRLQDLTEQILSRTRLQDTIDRLHLYPRPRMRWSSRDAVVQMRNDIKIDLVGEPGRPGEYSAFRMSYSASSPELARRVNEELTSLFISENVNAQRQLSENTTAFLESQLAEARKNMSQQEAKVAEFKSRHLGELPGQLESNMQILAGLQAQFQGAQQSLDAARQQKLYLESLLQQYDSLAASLDGEFPVSPLEALDKQLATARARLQELQMRYTEGHPDVIAVRNQIAATEQLKKQTEAERFSHPTSGAERDADDSSVPTDAAHASQAPVMQVQSQLKANQLEITNIQKHQKNLEEQISAYQTRLNVTPETEQELTGISRGYEESRSNYNSLLQKQMQSQLATSLEHRQQGEQFHVVDPPSLPKKPSAPNHLWISLGGLLAGICAGLGVAAVLELTQPRVRREKDLENIVPAGVLVAIPHLATAREMHERAVNWRTEVGVAAGLAVVMILGNLYAMIKG